MAKGIGLIGNFKGKVGNMVGYKLSDSNTGNSQGIRVYQPIVRNPKTSAQAEQRAKLAPINATYRALKMVIDRGNEGLPYGNKSRLAWLKQAFKAANMPWFVKGQTVSSPVLCMISKGSLPSIITFTKDYDYAQIAVEGITAAGTTTVGALSTALLAAYPMLKDSDQLTWVECETLGEQINAHVNSLVIDTASTAAIPSFLSVEDDMLVPSSLIGDCIAACIIVSREGANGEHLRSTEYLAQMSGYKEDLWGASAKAAAIASYQNSASANADWAEESIQ